MVNKFKLATKRIAAIAASAAIVSSGAFAGVLNNYPQNFAKDGKFVGKVVVGAAAQAIDTTSANSIIDDLAATFSGDKTQVRISYKKTSDASGESVLIADSGEHLNYGENLGTVKTSDFDKDDSDLLEDETLKLETTEDYEQTLTLPTNGYFEYSLRDDLDEDIGDHIYFEKGDIIKYKLELDSSMDMDDVEDKDIVGKKITIMGNEFTIGDDWSKEDTDADGTTDEGLDKLKLIGGANKVTLGEGDTTTVSYEGKSYDVSIQSVSTDEVMLSVNGETVSIDEYDSEVVAGVNIAVTDLVESLRDAVKGYAEIVVGGQEILLEDGKEVKINDEKISDLYDDYLVTVAFDNTNVQGWDGFTITYKWDDSDGFMLKKGDSYDDKVFQAFSINYEGNNDVDYSTIKISSADDKVKVEGKTIDEKDFSEEVAYLLDKSAADSPLRLIGGDDDVPMFVEDVDFTNDEETADSVMIATVATPGTPITGATSLTAGTQYFIYVNSDATDAYASATDDILFTGTGAEIDALFVQVTGAGSGDKVIAGIKSPKAADGLRFLTGDSDNQQLYEITDYDETEDEYSFKDILSDSTEDDKKYNEVASKLDDLADFTATTSDVMTIIDNQEANVNIAFENEALLDLRGLNQLDVDDASMVITYDTDDMNDGLDATSDAHSVTIKLGDYDTSDKAFSFVLSADYVSYPSGAEADVAKDDDDTQEYVTKLGTIVKYDNDEREWVEVATPDKQVYAKVSLVFGEAGSTEVGSVVVDADKVDAKKAELEADGYTVTGTEDVEAADVEFDVTAPVFDTDVTDVQDLIVVGGPAVNMVARQLLGITNYDLANEELQPGDAVAKYYADSNSVLVYGYTGEDTAAIVEQLNAGTANFE